MARSISDNSGSDAPPPPGHNALTEEQFLNFVRELSLVDQKLDEIKATRKGIRKRAKAAGIELGHLDAVVRMADWSMEEVREYFGTRTRYALWLRLPLGAQADLFAEEQTAPVAAIDKAAEWEAKGFRAAITENGSYGKPPPECPPEHHQDWLHGVNRGTAKNAEGLKQKTH